MKKTEAFETLPQMAERIKRQQLEALEMEFPPRWLRPGWQKCLLCTVIASPIIIAFSVLVALGEKIDKTGVLMLLVPGLWFVFSVFLGVAIGEMLERGWRRRHPNHPFANDEARDAAIAKASDPRLLRLAAISEFLGRTERRTSEQTGHYRLAPDRLDAIGEVHTLQEFLADPSCYRGMNHLNAPVGVRIATDDPPSTDEEKADIWFAELAERYGKALVP